MVRNIMIWDKGLQSMNYCKFIIFSETVLLICLFRISVKLVLLCSEQSIRINLAKLTLFITPTYVRDQ